MSISWPRTVAFVLVSLGILALVAVYDVPLEETVDRTTGVDRGDVPVTEAMPLRTDSTEALRLARERGDAPQSLALLRGMRGRASDPEGLDGPIRMLEQELLAPREVEDRLVAEGRLSRPLEKRRAAAERLAAWTGGVGDVRDGIALLRDLQLDQGQAAWMDAFYSGASDARTSREDLKRWLEEGGAPDRAASAALRLSEGGPDGVPADVCVEVARNFDALRRPRARLRWLLRGLASEPSSAAVALDLADTLLRLGRNREACFALAVATAAGADGREVQKLRASVAAWSSVPAEEAAALEGVLRWVETAPVRPRLVELYRYLGDARSALPHVVALARADGTPEALGSAGAAALDAGETRLAVALLDEASLAAPDPRPWRERIVDAWLGDLRVGEAIAELTDLARRWPDEGYEARLVGLLRRAGRSEQLADNLLARIRRAPDAAAEAEAIDLFTTLGRPDRVREILALRIRRTEDPVAFFTNLPGWRELDLPGLPEKAFEMASADSLDAEGAGIALEALRPYRSDPRYLLAAGEVLRRFPDHPAAIPFLAEVAEDETAVPEEERVLDAEEEIRMLVERARRPDLPLDARRDVAERLFAVGRTDLARTLFTAVLEESPDDRLALLRSGQIHAWGDDPYAAVRLLERCMELHGPGDGELPFQLGEVYRACARDDEAREMHELALGLLREADGLTPTRESRVARVLARLGRGEEARAICERLVALAPDNADLVLDQADILSLLDDIPAALEAVARAKAIAPDLPRVLKLEGQLLLESDRPAKALARFSRGRREHGPDAGFLAGIAEASLRLGRIADASEALGEAVGLQPGNRNLGHRLRTVEDRLASPVVEVEAEHRRIGDDRLAEVRVEGSVLLDRDATRLSAMLARGSFRGAAADPDGTTGLHEVSRSMLAFGVSRRFGADLELAGGLDLRPGAGGRAMLGAWVEGRREWRKPYQSLQWRLFAGEPLREPTVAVAFDGFRDGLSLAGFRAAEDPDWWASGRIEASRVSVDPVGRGRLADVRLEAEALAGIWIRGAGPEVHPRVWPRRADPVRPGTTAAGEPPEDRGPRVGAWLAWSGMRHLDEGKLSGVMPVTDRYDYLTASVRAVGSFGGGWHWEVEAYGGTDLRLLEPYGGVLAGAAWRPGDDFEIRIAASHGFAFARVGAGDQATGLFVSLTTDF